MSPILVNRFYLEFLRIAHYVVNVVHIPEEAMFVEINSRSLFSILIAHIIQVYFPKVEAQTVFSRRSRRVFMASKLTISVVTLLSGDHSQP